MVFENEKYNPGTSSILLATSLATDLSLAGVYTLRLKAHQADFPNLVVERDFIVEIINPCLTATFVIDENNSVFESDPD